MKENKQITSEKIGKKIVLIFFFNLMLRTVYIFSENYSHPGRSTGAISTITKKNRLTFFKICHLFSLRSNPRKGKNPVGLHSSMEAMIITGRKWEDGEFLKVKMLSMTILSCVVGARWSQAWTRRFYHEFRLLKNSFRHSLAGWGLGFVWATIGLRKKIR